MGCHAYVRDLLHVMEANGSCSPENGSRYRFLADWLLTRFSNRSMPAKRVARPYVRMLPGPQWLYLLGSGQRTRVPDGSHVRIGRPRPGECSHEGLHGVPKLLCQWWNACQKWNCAGSACHGLRQALALQEVPPQLFWWPQKPWKPWPQWTSLEQQLDGFLRVRRLQ